MEMRVGVGAGVGPTGARVGVFVGDLVFAVPAALSD